MSDNNVIKTERRNKMILRRMERILARRVRHMGVTIHQGGFVKCEDLMDKAPLFKRMDDITVADVLKILGDDTEKRFTVQGDYVKVNNGHVFDLTDTALPAVPAN